MRNKEFIKTLIYMTIGQIIGMLIANLWAIPYFKEHHILGF